MNLPLPLMLIGSIITGAFVSYFAYQKGKNPYVWFFIGLIFGIFGLFAFLLPFEKKQKALQKPLPLPTLLGPVDKLWYYLDPANGQQGPLSRDAITKAWREGKLTLSSFVWHEDLPEWKPLKEMIKQ